MPHRPNDSNVPAWIAKPIGGLAAAFVGPAILGMIGFIAAVLAPLAVVVLPFILWGLSRSGPSQHSRSRPVLPPRRVHRPILRPA